MSRRYVPSSKGPTAFQGTGCKWSKHWNKVRGANITCANNMLGLIDIDSHIRPTEPTETGQIQNITSALYKVREFSYTCIFLQCQANSARNDSMSTVWHRFYRFQMSYTWRDSTKTLHVDVDRKFSCAYYLQDMQVIQNWSTLSKRWHSPACSADANV